MDQGTRIFYPPQEDYQQMGDNAYSSGPGYYQEGYDEYAMDVGENMDGYDSQYEEEAYAVYDESGGRRFHVAMNVFDTASILMGIVVILALTALIVSMVSWLQADITHSFVLLQSNIQ